ncbi:MAG TPA: iron ABC transporter permease [Terriglobia bacterium]|jgi:iron complex transport system permease protein|nr:iron ABC transporter permease [Terriglobia bacterium]
MSVPATRRNLLLTIVLLSVGLVVVSLAALMVGGVHLPLRQVWVGLWGAGPAGQAEVIVREIRLPRVLLAMLVGAALASSGTALQALLRNPLADPYVLGISSGAALGAIVALWVGGRVANASPLAAFAGALVTMVWVFALGRRAGRLSSYTLLLAGVVTASFLSAVIIFVLSMLSTRDVRGTAFWLMGDLSVVTDVQLHLLLPVIALGIGGLYFFAKDLNVLLLGEQESAHLGVNVTRVETLVYILASLLTGVAVSVSGAIGYLGLLVPHLGRMVVGSDHRMLIPTAALGGAIMLVVSDLLARTLVAPGELPVGAVTAVAGAPVFIYLLRRTTG